MAIGALDASQAVADKGADYLALPPSLLPSRVKDAARQEGMFEVGIKSGGRQGCLGGLHGGKQPHSLALHVRGGVGVPVWGSGAVGWGEGDG